VQRTNEAVQTVKAVANGQRGEIHVGYAPSLTVELLPRALRSFQEANPGSARSASRPVHPGNVARTSRRQAARRPVDSVSAKVLTGLVFEELHRYAVCVAVHPAHPLARVRKIGLEQVAAERLITLTLADYPEYHAWLSNLFTPLETSPADREEHDSATSLIASVEAVAAWLWFTRTSTV
jgi:DNA-binding transcriptional LysR family regulator